MVYVIFYSLLIGTTYGILNVIFDCPVLVSLEYRNGLIFSLVAYLAVCYIWKRLRSATCDARNTVSPTFADGCRCEVPRLHSWRGKGYLLQLVSTSIMFNICINWSIKALSFWRRSLAQEHWLSSIQLSSNLKNCFGNGILDRIHHLKNTLPNISTAK